MSNQPLSDAQKAVATAYITPGATYLNKTKAYKAVKPTVTDASASVSGHRVLRNAKVKEWVQEQLSASGVTKEVLEQQIANNLSRSWSEGKLSDHLNATVALAKLRGDWTEKQEVKQVSDAERDAIRRVVSESLTQPN